MRLEISAVRKAPCFLPRLWSARSILQPARVRNRSLQLELHTRFDTVHRPINSLDLTPLASASQGAAPTWPLRWRPMTLRDRRLLGTAVGQHF